MNNTDRIVESSRILVTTMKKYLYIIEAHIDRLKAEIDGIRQLILEEGEHVVLSSGRTADLKERLYSREEELKAIKELRDKIANS